MVVEAKAMRKKGNWIPELKNILHLGPGNQLDFGDDPKAKHRGTKTAVKLLLSNLRKGAGKTQNQDSNEDDIKKVVFNAVDLLVRDKVDKSKHGKTQLEALMKFGDILDEEFAAQANKKGSLDDKWKGKIQESIRALRQEAMESFILSNTGNVDQRKQYAEAMILSDEGQKALGANGALAVAVLSLVKDKPNLASNVLGLADPASLQNFDFAAAFGDSQDDIFATTLLAITKKPLPQGGNLDRSIQLDPALFTLLAKKVKPEIWNDQTATVPPRKGLGPQVCQSLWKCGGYDQICELIGHGVDTSLASRASSAGGRGVYMGFVQPIQHIISTYVRDIALVENGTNMPDARKSEALGAKKIFKALGDNAATLSQWSDVKNSEMLAEFEKNPGTIWGFENIRLPYVQAAHETKEGAQPLRMLELWESVYEVTTNAQNYADLLDKPDETIDKLVKTGVQKIKTKVNDPKYDDVRGRINEFITNFERDAKAFLTEFVAQMPKSTYAHNKTDGKAVGLSDVAGIMATSVVGAMACKAGLWWAKSDGKPVYYCLDGLNMDDVTNYKKLKNKAVEDFITSGGTPGTEDAHREVITLAEVREILKNWDELKDTVKFVLKGKILKGEELEKKIAAWQKKMQEVNKQAGRTPAPPKSTFTSELQAIDPELVRNIPDTPEGNMDARDIVKKYGYLVKVANTRPHIVLKYIISRCEVLTKYGLLSRKLPSAAATLIAAIEKKLGDKKIGTATERVGSEIKKCHADFQKPLEDTLVNYQLAKEKKI